MSDTEPRQKKQFVIRARINGYLYLFKDALLFRELGHRRENDANSERWAPWEKSQCARTAAILYVFSLEALINRVMDEFGKGETRIFFKEKEKSLSILDKYWLVPKLVSGSGETFDKGGQVWQSLNELVKMRNEFVHSKSERTATT